MTLHLYFLHPSLGFSFNWLYFFDLGLSRLGFKHPTSCLRVDALAHCVTKAVFEIVIFSKHFNVFLLLVLVIFPTWNSLDMTLHFRVVNNPSPTLIDKNLRILSQTWRVKYLSDFSRNQLGFNSTFTFVFHYLLPIKHFLSSQTVHWINVIGSRRCKHNVKIYSGDTM